MYYASATDATGKFMNFSEEATEVFYEKNSHYSQESSRPATLFKKDSNTGVFL